MVSSKRLLTIVFVVFTLPLTVFSVSSVNAKDSDMSSLDKIKINNAHEAHSILWKSTTIGNLIDSRPQIPISNNSSFDDCHVPMPNTVMEGSENSSPKLSCKEFLLGKGKWPAILTAPELNDADYTKAANYLKKLSYRNTSPKNSELKCMYLQVSYHPDDIDGGAAERFESFDRFTKEKFCINASETYIASIKPYGLDKGDDRLTISKDDNYHFSVQNEGEFIFGSGIDATGDTSWSDFINKWKSAAKERSSNNSMTYVVHEESKDAAKDTALKDDEYTKGTSALFIQGVFNTGGGKEPLTTAEVYNIYVKYLDNSTYVSRSCDDGTFDESWMEVKLKKDGKIVTCHVTEKKVQKYTGARRTNVKAGEYYFTREDMSLKDIINDINSFDLESILKDLDDTSGNEESPDDNSETTETTCQNSGGAGSLGWIVCSILDWMAGATEDLYDGVVKPALNVEPDLFNGGNDSTLAAWEIFRNFANIIFIILVLFVIFSQLTGVGIDNYGIKKILPKLVAVAVLVNLSYLICLICVDLSNIVGNGVQRLFNGMAETSTTLDISTVGGASTPEDAASSNKIAVNVGADAGITAVAVAGAAIGAYAIYSNPALLLTLFIAVLGVLISILFVFILLAGRKAAIVLLTVLSPIAFILYMLPNTKKIFDKWLNLWKAMLLVYPICGLLIGGGNFASKLMLSVGDPSNAVTAFTAMIVGIVPIFFIPTVIKSAYAALGSMGGAIAGFGGRLSGGATRGMRNSRLNQNAQKRSQERGQRINAMRRAGVRLDKDGNVVESRRPTARLRRRIASSDNGFLKFINRRTGLEASMGQSATEFTKLEAARRGNMAAGNNTDAMNATLAGLAGKESDQRVSDQETLMRAGKVMMGSERLNIDDAKQMESYHRQLLQSANANRAAGNMAGYNSDMDKIKAAQNIMAKSDPGRSSMQRNYQEAIEKGYTGGLSNAASHLKGAHGPDIKAANRAMNSLVEDLAQGVDTASIQNKIDNHTYDINSISGYNARSLVSADDGALDGLKNSVAAISSMTNENGQNEKRDQLNALIDDALSNKNIQSQPKVEAKLRQIRDDLNRPSGGPYGYDIGGI